MMNWELILRIFVAGILGGLIGLEREYRAKEAGFRTHFLVALGASLFMVISAFGFGDVLGESPIKLDPSRIAAQVVTGIGFIGAGTIIFQKHVVRGLTTAAGLWVTAAIGMAIGGGLYVLGVATTLIVLLALEAFTIGVEALGMRMVSVMLWTEEEENMVPLLKKLSEKGIEVDVYTMEQHRGRYEINLELKLKKLQMNKGMHDFMLLFEGFHIEKIV